MALVFYGHPFSSYAQKVLIALYENALAFSHRELQPGDADANSEWRALWPFAKMPVLVDAGRTVAESSIIIEHLHLAHRGPVALLPDDAVEALEVRFMDRFFDHHVMNHVQAPVAEALRADGRRDTALVEARERLQRAYAWLEQRLQGRTWAAGEAFSMADCAAAPSLFYADWVHPIAPEFPTVRAYRERLLRRPSMARAVEQARPYRAWFPLGAPDRD
jgi:glutathione S-transferase